MADDTAVDMQRPTLDLGTDTSETAIAEAVTALVTQLQCGIDTSDADAYDALFADDILWGSPKGRTLQGFTELNRIHHDLMADSVAPPSIFTVERTSSPAPGVVIALISRNARDGGFSEMAMYVLVRRDGRWWLAAAQNTPIADTPAG
jgi:uncharacterized protein (TIGR02246 family)